MTSERLFQVVNFAPLPFWALMIIAPRWWLTRKIMGTLVAPALFAALYAILIVPRLRQLVPALLSLTELTTFTDLMRDPELAVIAWVHYLAFDLFVGRWEYLDGLEKGLSPWLVGPALFLTLMLGPAGFLAYLAIREITRPHTHPVRP